MKLHLEFEDFVGDLMQPSIGDPNIYELARVLPPGSHRYFFTYKGELVCGKGQSSLEPMAESAKKVI